MEGPCLTIRIEASRILLAVLTVLHGAAMLAPLAADLAPWLRLLLALVAGRGLLVVLRNYGAERRAGPLCLRIQDGAWSLGRGEAMQRVELLGDTTVWERLIVLRFRLGDARVHSLPVLPDSCGAEELRRLRVVLRMAPGPVTGGDSG